MINHPIGATNLRLFLPETLWLEPEYFEQAREISHSLNDESQQWQAYLNTLGMLALSAWLKEQLPKQPIQQIFNKIEDTSYLRVGEFILCLIATEHVLDEIVRIPIAINQPELAAHFYIWLEVLEDQEQVIVRGFLRHDELTHSNRVVASPSDQSDLFPLAALDTEINHLVLYVQHSEPGTIPLPTAATQPVATALPQGSSTLKTRLSQWLEGILDEGWQTIDTLVNPEVNLAWSTRHTPSSAKGGKLINFGIQLGTQTVVLLITVNPDSEGKIGVSAQVLPAGGVQVLPSQLKLTLLSDKDKILQEVQSREQDNYIQLKQFKGRQGINFRIEVSLNDIRVRETFEL